MPPNFSVLVSKVCLWNGREWLSTILVQRLKQAKNSICYESSNFSFRLLNLLSPWQAETAEHHFICTYQTTTFFIQKSRLKIRNDDFPDQNTSKNGYKY